MHHCQCVQSKAYSIPVGKAAKLSFCSTWLCDVGADFALIWRRKYVFVCLRKRLMHIVWSTLVLQTCRLEILNCLKFHVTALMAWQLTHMFQVCWCNCQLNFTIRATHMQIVGKALLLNVKHYDVWFMKISYLNISYHNFLFGPLQIIVTILSIRKSAWYFLYSSLSLSLSVSLRMLHFAKITPIVDSSGRKWAGIFSLKHESSIFRSFNQPCMWFWKCQASSQWDKQYRA